MQAYSSASDILCFGREGCGEDRVVRADIGDFTMSLVRGEACSAPDQGFSEREVAGQQVDIRLGSGEREQLEIRLPDGVYCGAFLNFQQGDAEAAITLEVEGSQGLTVFESAKQESVFLRATGGNFRVGDDQEFLVGLDVLPWFEENVLNTEETVALFPNQEEGLSNSQPEPIATPAAPLEDASQIDASTVEPENMIGEDQVFALGDYAISLTLEGGSGLLPSAAEFDVNSLSLLDQQVVPNGPSMPVVYEALDGSMLIEMNIVGPIRRFETGTSSNYGVDVSISIPGGERWTFAEGVCNFQVGSFGSPATDALQIPEDTWAVGGNITCLESAPADGSADALTLTLMDIDFLHQQ